MNSPISQRAHSKFALHQNSSISSNMNNLPTSKRILLALKELESAEKINYAATALKYDIDRTTLSRRFRGVTRSREEYISEDCQLLTRKEEEGLLEYIDILDKRGI